MRKTGTFAASSTYFTFSNQLLFAKFLFWGKERFNLVVYKIGKEKKNVYWGRKPIPYVLKPIIFWGEYFAFFFQLSLYFPSFILKE